MAARVERLLLLFFFSFFLVFIWNTTNDETSSRTFFNLFSSSFRLINQNLLFTDRLHSFLFLLCFVLEIRLRPYFCFVSRRHRRVLGKKSRQYTKNTLLFRRLRCTQSRGGLSHTHIIDRTKTTAKCLDSLFVGSVCVVIHFVFYTLHRDHVDLRGSDFSDIYQLSGEKSIQNLNLFGVSSQRFRSDVSMNATNSQNNGPKQKNKNEKNENTCFVGSRRPTNARERERKSIQTKILVIASLPRRKCWLRAYNVCVCVVFLINFGRE